MPRSKSIGKDSSKAPTRGGRLARTLLNVLVLVVVVGSYEIDPAVATFVVFPVAVLIVVCANVAIGAARKVAAKPLVVEQAGPVPKIRRPLPWGWALLCASTAAFADWLMFGRGDGSFSSYVFFVFTAGPLFIGVVGFVLFFGSLIR